MSFQTCITFFILQKKKIWDFPIQNSLMGMRCTFTNTNVLKSGLWCHIFQDFRGHRYVQEINQKLSCSSLNSPWNIHQKKINVRFVKNKIIAFNELIEFLLINLPFVFLLLIIERQMLLFHTGQSNNSLITDRKLMKTENGSSFVSVLRHCDAFSALSK